jgi:hypothetical protein
MSYIKIILNIPLDETQRRLDVINGYFDPVQHILDSLDAIDDYCGIAFAQFFEMRPNDFKDYAYMVQRKNGTKKKVEKVENTISFSNFTFVKDDDDALMMIKLKCGDVGIRRIIDLRPMYS